MLWHMLLKDNRYMQYVIIVLQPKDWVLYELFKNEKDTMCYDKTSIGLP